MLLNVLNVKSENKVVHNEPAEFYRCPAATLLIIVSFKVNLRCQPVNRHTDGGIPQPAGETFTIWAATMKYENH